MATLHRDALLADFNRHFIEDCWAGPSVLQTLELVTAAEAAAKPLANVHSIWELVLHMATWMDVGRWRLEGSEKVPSDEENFPPVTDAGEAAWQAALKTHRAAFDKLVTAISACDDDKLNDQIPAGKGLTHLARLSGIIQHNMYHSGQVILLRKAQGWSLEEHLKKLGIA